MSQKVSFSTKLDQNTFSKGNLAILYSKPTILVTTFVFGAYFLFAVVTAITGNTQNLLLAIPALIFGGIMPYVIFKNARKAFSHNPRLAENIVYTFENNKLELKGESFNNEVTLDKVFKVSKTKNYILVWHSKFVANIIPLKNTSPADIVTLRSILNDSKVKNNL